MTVLGKKIITSWWSVTEKIISVKPPLIRAAQVQVVRYQPAVKRDWDSFIEKSKNGTFLFYRDYMDYHADRFPDHSLMLFEDQALVALLPATVHEGIFSSHAGLTYGGFVVGRAMKVARMLRILDAVANYLIANGMKKFIYKAIPHIYHRAPSGEDLYALFVSNFRLVRREVSSTIALRNFHIPAKRANGARKAEKSGICVEQSSDYETFFKMVNDRLEKKYHVSAVHSAAEMKLLQRRFPENVKLHTVMLSNEMVGGALTYETDRVVHTQYLSTTALGRKLRALDLLIISVLEGCRGDKTWFDFGISTQDGGRTLNESLVKQKEEFGASALNYDTYELELS